MKRRLQCNRLEKLPTEFVYGLALITLSGLGERLRPFRMIYRIGVILGFQCNTGPFAVVNTVLAVLVQKIASIELNTGAISMDSHSAAGTGVP